MRNLMRRSHKPYARGHVWLALLLMVVQASLAWAQENGPKGETQMDKDPPQILTSELSLTQVVHKPLLKVHFIIADKNNISEVSINGEAQAIKNGPNVLVTREFQLIRGYNRIEVTAVDEKGNTRTKSYLVAYQPALWLSLDFELEAKIENDDNPTTLLSQGSANNSNQPDTLSTLKMVFGANYGDIFGGSGLVDASYANSDNEALESRMVYLVVGYRFKASDAVLFPISFTFTDMDSGGNDFALMRSESLGISYTNQNDVESTITHMVRFELTSKDFALDILEDGSQYKLSWDYSNMDKNKLNSLGWHIAMGNNTDGVPITDFNFINIGFDTRLRWENGYLLEGEFGIQQRNYLNDEQPLVGETRLDQLSQLHLGTGWRFRHPNLTVKISSDIFNNASNKRPYKRNLYGFAMQAAF